ncbi:MAG: membrane protein insertion efficiency factor YidD [Verrucomicrobia bacterium]|nr:membrane protein insertion efficiency factor YidD [Verrucomicrobiota bacterium]
MRSLFVFLIRAQRIAAPAWRSLLGSPGSCCRFHPTCSEYAEEAVRHHGVGRGLLLSLRRLARCHPWGGSGWNPVKETL